MEIQKILATFGIEKTNNGASTGSEWIQTKGEKIESYSPVDGSLIASVAAAEEEDYEKVIAKASEAYKVWRTKPAPLRGEVIRQLAEKLREVKELSLIHI